MILQYQQGSYYEPKIGLVYYFINVNLPLVMALYGVLRISAAVAAAV